MAETFGAIWNKVLLYAPNTPVPLAQQMVRNAYNRVLNLHYWSELWGEGEKVIPTIVSTGTATTTVGSATVAFSSAIATSSMVGLQFIGNSTITGYYDIIAVPTSSSVTLDKVWAAEAITTGTYQIGEFYVRFPTDLRTLDDIRDIHNNWRLRRQYHQQNYLDRIDARRRYTGAPILYVEAKPLVSSTGVVTPRYEFFPRLVSGAHLVYRYIKNATLTANTDYPISTLRSEALVWGALAELALWPGTSERPNPFFSIDQHREYDKMFLEAVQDSEQTDLDRAQRMLIYDDDSMGYPADAKFMQERGLPY